MKTTLMGAVLASALTLTSGAAEAKGCIKGAIAGGIAGHMTGHGGLKGAMVGCVTGYAIHKGQRYRAERQRAQETRQVSRQAPGSPAHGPGPAHIPPTGRGY
jgi:uncharacterized protein YcfJ